MVVMMIMMITTMTMKIGMISIMMNMMMDGLVGAAGAADHSVFVILIINQALLAPETSRMHWRPGDALQEWAKVQAGPKNLKASGLKASQNVPVWDKELPES